MDYSILVEKGTFLEGTGSIVIDHPNKVVYACKSPRTDIKLLSKVVMESYGENFDTVSCCQLKNDAGFFMKRGKPRFKFKSGTD